MTQNSLTIEAVVFKTPKLTSSPVGIKHCQFTIEHRSMQVEAQMNRQAFVRMQVVATGDWSQHLTSELVEGKQVRVTGFLNRHETRNGNPLLVLHAQQIEMIN
ncbi:primosomal replication protein N [Thalassotalea eurytherma]|nr:primosomal replication protein N [Thalassotalea eurytherma]